MVLVGMTLVAQRPIPGGFPRNPNDQLVDSTEQEELTDEPPDTILYYSPFKLKQAVFFSDTTLSNVFHQYDVIRYQSIPYAHLGNVGSSYRPLVFNNEKRQGLDLGSHIFDLYKQRYEDLELFESRRPFFIARFGQRNFRQEDLQLEPRLGKTFQNGLHLNLMYRTIQYKGDFLQQITKHHTGAVNFWYHAPKGNYDFILSYLFNDIRQQDHGGIPNAEAFLKQSTYRSNPLTIDEYYIDGRTKQNDKSLSIQNGFNVHVKGTKMGFTHRISTQNSSNTFFDETSSIDSTYYDQYYVRDTQDITFKSNGIVNEFRLDGLIKESSYLMAGLKHEWHKINQGPSQNTLNLLSIIGEYDQTIAGKFHFNGEGQWGILDNLGEYYLNGKISAESKTLGAIEGHAILQRSPVPWMFRKLYSHNQLLYDYNFDKPLTNQLGGSINIAAIGFKAGLDQSIISNTIYLNASRTPSQEKTAISITSVYGDKTIDFGKFHSHHKLIFQFSTNQNVMRIPAWYTQNVIYYQSNWFKNNMFLQTGLDSRVLPSFKTQSYFPLLGNFYNSERAAVALHPSVEFFFNFQLKNFRGFFKVEGLEYFMYYAGKTFYETYEEPLFRTNMRLGFSWILRD
jgi:hypothetical protein